VPFGNKRVASQINEIIYERLGHSENIDSKPEITEENLDGSADQQIANAANEAWDRSPEKVAAILKDSGLIIWVKFDYPYLIYLFNNFVK